MTTDRAQMRIHRKASIVGLIALLVAALVPSAARATASTCSRAGNKVHLQVVIPPTIRLFVTAKGEIKWVDPKTPADAQDCGGATVDNTDTVQVSNFASEDTVVILDLRRRFAPGATPEASGKSEIEIKFTVNDRDNEDTLQIRGRAKSDRFVAGVDGIAVNKDGDVDVPNPLIEKFVFLGKGGRDFLSGGGGNGTGEASSISLTVYGNGGDDDIRGSTVEDQLLGSGGDDRMIGAGKGDVVFGNDGADILFGRRGSDELDGMAGRDRLRGNGGADDLEGGVGIDDCDGGPGADTIASCERGDGD